MVMISPEVATGETVHDVLMQSGRGAALTEDGYFLTAFHVVEDGPFVWNRLRGMERLQPGRSYTATERAALIRNESFRGRLVWSDADLDLAIVKFEVNGLVHFGGLVNDIESGQTIFTADDGGASLVDLGGRSSDQVGNGDFVAAGSIIARIRGSDEIGGLQLKTSLVARGGMSGAPLVTGDGQLCGILTGAVRDRLGRIFSVASMIRTETIRSIIDEDRR